MKRQISRLIIILLLIFPIGISCSGKTAKSSEGAEDISALLPGDDEIPGWKKSGGVLLASSDRELFQFLDGGVPLYIQHGFQSYIGQIYKGPQGVELEVAIYDQGSPKNARDLYEDPLIKPNPCKSLKNLGEKARLDERGLFHHSVEFIQDRFFGRVIIQDKSEEGLETAKRFVSPIVSKVKGLKKFPGSSP